MIWSEFHSAVLCLVLGTYGSNGIVAQAKECPVNFAKVGCFKDKGSYKAPNGPPRPLDYLLLTDRDTSSPVFSGKTIRWREWKQYVSDLACRCAQASHSKGYHVFGLQYFGECWSGSRGELLYSRDGKSTQCTSALNYRACADLSSVPCVGNAHVNYVYIIEQGDCGQLVDLAILLDSSGSIRFKNWKKIRLFLKTLVDELGSASDVHFSVMEYSVSTRIEMKFGEYTTTEQLKTKLDSLPYLRNFTRTDIALKKSISQIFTVENGVRPVPVKRVLLLVSDGKNNGKDQQIDWSQRVLAPAKELRDNDVTVYALGVTDDVNKNELETIVSPPSALHVINMNQYKDLVDAVRAFRRLICEVQ